MNNPPIFLVILVFYLVSSTLVEAKGTKKESADLVGSSATPNGLPYFEPETVSAAKGTSKTGDAGNDQKGTKTGSADSSTQDFAGTVYFPQVDTLVGASKVGKGADKTTKAPKAGNDTKAPRGVDGSTKTPKAGKDTKAPSGVNGSTKTPHAGKETKAPKGDNGSTKTPKAGKDTKAPKGEKDAKASKAPNDKSTKAPKASNAPKSFSVGGGSENIEFVTTSSAARACPFQPSGGALLDPSNVVGAAQPSTSGRGVLTIAFDSGFTQMEYSIFIANVPAINEITLNCISSGNSSHDIITSLSFRDPGSSYSSSLNGANFRNATQCEDGSVISNVVGLYDVMRRGLVYVEASVVDSGTGESPVFIRGGDVQVATSPGTC